MQYVALFLIVAFAVIVLGLLISKFKEIEKKPE
jgi:hypothetical protein